jgi:hypothetical protein
MKMLKMKPALTVACFFLKSTWQAALLSWLCCSRR